MLRVHLPGTYGTILFSRIFHCPRDYIKKMKVRYHVNYYSGRQKYINTRGAPPRRSNARLGSAHARNTEDV